MKRVMMLVGVLCLLTVGPGFLYAQTPVHPMTTGALLSACRGAIEVAEGREEVRSSQEGTNGLLCAGVGAAFLQLGRLWNADTIPYKYALPKVCLPEGISGTQVIRTFVRYAEDHPELRYRPIAWVMLASLQTAYPCP